MIIDSSAEIPNATTRDRARTDTTEVGMLALVH